MLSQERLKQVLHYDPSSGKWTWLKTRCWKAKMGDEAGCPNERGYITIGLFGHLYSASRLAHFYMTGDWPKFELDHINRNPSDNRWENLRQATRVENSANTRIKANNTSGYKGVHFSKKDGKYMVRIRHNGKRLYLGEFKCPELAGLVYAEHAAKFHGEFFTT